MYIAFDSEFAEVYGYKLMWNFRTQRRLGGAIATAPSELGFEEDFSR